MTLAPIAMNKENRKADGVWRGEVQTDVGCGPNAGSALDRTVIVTDSFSGPSTWCCRSWSESLECANIFPIKHGTLRVGPD